MSHILPVIIAGGTGTRLWPLSRELYPKQLLNLTEDVSLLQATIKRIIDWPDMLPPLIVVGEEHRFLTQNQIAELGLTDEITIILEPVGRDTAPAICAAAVCARARHDEDTVILVLPADQRQRFPGQRYDSLHSHPDRVGTGEQRYKSHHIQHCCSQSGSVHPNRRHTIHRCKD